MLRKLGNETTSMELLAVATSGEPDPTLAEFAGSHPAMLGPAILH